LSAHGGARWQSSGKKKGTQAAGSGSPASTANSTGGGIEGDYVFSLRGLGKTLPGGRVLFQNISLAFQRGAKIGLLGLNGSGKSSLLKVLAGVDTEFDGEFWKSDGLRVGYLQQEPQLDPSKNVHHNIMDGLKEKTDLLDRFEQLSAAMAEPDADLDAILEEQANVQSQIDHYDCWNLSHTVQIAKEALRVAPDDADVTLLSGGERRRVALCRLLLEQPEVLLLDEPTNHLDADSVAWLERFLRDYKGTVVAITHDRYFLDNVAGWILEIDRGFAFPYQGNYSVWLEKKSSRLDLEKRQEKKKAKAMEEELAWIRQGVRVRVFRFIPLHSAAKLASIQLYWRHAGSSDQEQSTHICV
jgi:sulfate-transporting ATPase